MLKSGYMNFRHFLGIFLGLSNLEMAMCDYVVDYEFKGKFT